MDPDSAVSAAEAAGPRPRPALRAGAGRGGNAPRPAEPSRPAGARRRAQADAGSGAARPPLGARRSRPSALGAYGDGRNDRLCEDGGELRVPGGAAARACSRGRGRGRASRPARGRRGPWPQRPPATLLLTAFCGDCDSFDLKMRVRRPGRDAKPPCGGASARSASAPWPGRGARPLRGP